MPRLSMMGLSCLPSSLSRSKFCMFRAPTWMTSTSSKSGRFRSMSSVTMGRPVASLAISRSRRMPSAHTLEGIGGGAGLEGAAPQHGGAAGLYRLGDGDHLLLGLHGAGAGDEGEVAAADLRVADLHDGILGVELPVGVLIGLLHPLDILHDVQRGNQVDVHLAVSPTRPRTVWASPMLV